jgi:hypothetical protein
MVQHNEAMPLPDSLPWMESVDAKMIRAHEHLEGFERESREYLASIDFKMYLKTSPNHAWPWMVTHANDYIPPIRLSAIAGDCVHDMRSALDNMICGLALTKNNMHNCELGKFPLTQAETEWPNAAQNYLSGVPREARKLLRDLQPWCDVIDPHPLKILNELSNRDKHRQSLMTMGYNRNVTYRVHCRNGDIIQLSPNRPLYLGDVNTFALPIHPSELNETSRVESSGTLSITFQQEGPWGDQEVLQILRLCFDYIKNKVIEPLTPFFQPVIQSVQ